MSCLKYLVVEEIRIALTSRTSYKGDRRNRVPTRQENLESGFMQLGTTYALQWNYSPLHTLPSDTERFRWGLVPWKRIEALP